jgi:transcriptional regulator with XRE-family HTH domain
MSQAKLFESVTPFWTREMGERLSIARMKMGLTQAELGRQLGVTQQTLCNIEAGRSGGGHFSLAKFRDAMGSLTFYVLYGAGAKGIDPLKVHRDFWTRSFKKGAEKRMERRPKPGNV